MRFVCWHVENKKSKSKTHVAVVSTILLGDPVHPRLRSNRSSIPRLRHIRRLSASELKETHVETWIQRELDDAEILPFVFNNEKSQCTQTRSLTASEENSYVPQCKSKTPSPKLTDRELLVEIENLRKEINSSQDERMLELQSKLSELQARQQHLKEDNNSPLMYISRKENILRNKLFQNASSRACNLL